MNQASLAVGEAEEYFTALRYPAPRRPAANTNPSGFPQGLNPPGVNPGFAPPGGIAPPGVNPGALNPRGGG